MDDDWGNPMTQETFKWIFNQNRDLIVNHFKKIACVTMRIVFSSPKIINALVFVWKICSKNHRVFTPNFGRGSPIETMVGVRDEIRGVHTMEVFF